MQNNLPGYVVVLKGESGEKEFQGRMVEAVPFVGCSIHDERFERGIGVLLPGGRTLFCGSGTRNPVILWRGMILLGQMPRVNEGIVRACLKGGNPKADLGDAVFAPTYHLFGGYKAFNEFRREVLRLSPDQKVSAQIKKGINDIHRATPSSRVFMGIPHMPESTQPSV